MRRRTFMRFVACCVALLPVGTSVIAAEGVLVSGPIVHDNLAIYFVHGQATRGAVPVSLEEALANGRVKVRETGTVNELTVENVGNDEIFIQAGDIVKGAGRTASCRSICCCRRGRDSYRSRRFVSNPAVGRLAVRRIRGNSPPRRQPCPRTKQSSPYDPIWLPPHRRCRSDRQTRPIGLAPIPDRARSKSGRR